MPGHAGPDGWLGLELKFDRACECNPRIPGQIEKPHSVLAAGRPPVSIERFQKGCNGPLRHQAAG